MSDTFCPLPWLQGSIKPSGMMTTCCVMKPLVKNRDDNSTEIQERMIEGKLKYSRLWWEHNNNVYICGKDSILDVLNSDTLKEVRLYMLKGKKHPLCSTCWQRER